MKYPGPGRSPTSGGRRSGWSVRSALDLEPECGGGGCQHLAGEFLYHCHVAHHYVAGMWGYGRFYNTLQVGNAHTDTMPDMRELPDRLGRMKQGVVG